MAKLVHWEWSIGPFVHAYLAAAREDRRNLQLVLPSDPARPMAAVVSHRLGRFVRSAPEPAKITKLHLQKVALDAFERLLGLYCGADVERTMLIEPVSLKLPDDSGAIFSFPVVLVWDAGVFGAFARSEVQLTDEFWVERILFQNELQHHAEELEE